MHIEAELDEAHAERLLRLQRRLNKPLPEVVAGILNRALEEGAGSLRPVETPAAIPGRDGNAGVVRPGIWKALPGKLWMAEDFDEPLDDFNEYREAGVIGF